MSVSTAISSLALLVLIPAFGQVSGLQTGSSLTRSTATYQMVFTSSWSASTHPDDFPGNAHYSPLVGATHLEPNLLWAPDSLATPGIESMAETGGTATLSGEIDEYKTDGTAQFQIDGPGLNTSPDDAAVTFDITTEHPLISIVTMVAPSPDWFAGVNSLNLFQSGNWVDSISVTAFAYDAGSDDGASYTSDDLEANPHQPIAQIDESPFKVGDDVVPIGVFTFTLVSVLNTDGPDPEDLVVHVPYPNPFTHRTTITLSSPVPATAVLDLYDILGRKVKTAFSGTINAGASEVIIEGSDLAPGLYIYQIKIGENAQSGTIVLAR